MWIQQHVLQHPGYRTVAEVTCLQSGGRFCHSFSSPSNYLISCFPKGTFHYCHLLAWHAYWLIKKTELQAGWALTEMFSFWWMSVRSVSPDFFFPSLWDSSHSCYQRIGTESEGSESIGSRAEKGKRRFGMASVMGAKRKGECGGCGLELKERWKIWDLARLWTAVMSDPTEVQDD